MQTFDAFDGGLLVDKPAGPTSHDLVDVVRRHFGFKKVGHCGTLDPAATGLMILVLGKATRLSEKLMGSDKVYEGGATFGTSTSSFDAEGEITATAPLPELTVEQLDVYCQAFLGDHMQTPPMVSAVKIQGVPLYKLARKGVEVERKPRLIHIYNFRFTSYTPPSGSFRVACTKGTYVRTLIHELGQTIGCGAYLSRLRRTAIDLYDVADAIPFEELIQMTPEQLRPRIIPFLALGAC
ncbi:MAG: tRNA pseudouridine(55) synthase TruB [Verrucomicrobia bacterium]|nr:tRNA pseudouridine(55) synthase TruB [Verrucomicrobiota bacterium]